MTSNSKGKGKARQIQTASRSPSPDLHGSGHLTNPNDDSASVGIPVPSDPYHNFAFPNTNVGATQSNVLPHNPFFSAPNPDFVPLNPYIAHSNAEFAPPNLNFDPLNPPAPASPNIIAPLPRLAHNTAFLEQIAESYRPLPFWRQRASEARASARPQPYDLMARQRSLRDDDSQVRQIEFEGDPLMGIVPELPRPNTRALRARPTGGPSTAITPAAGPSTVVTPAAGPSTAVPPTAGPSTLRRNTRRPADPSPSDNARELSNLINDEARVEMKNLILNDDFMLRGNELLSAMDDAIIIAVMKHSPDQVTARQWITKNSEKAKKSLRMVPVNLRNDIKRLARIIASGSWGLSPAFEDHVQDIVAYRAALVEAILNDYNHVDSGTAPFGHPSVTIMAQAIIRLFRCHLPANNDDINVDNIIAFAVTMLRFAVREFSGGTYEASEFVVEEESLTYDEVITRIGDLTGTDFAFYQLVIEHILKLL